MTLATLLSRTPQGLEAPLVRVEVDVGSGLPAFSVVGLLETTVKESKDRVRAALANCGYEFPAGRVTVNLAPADLPKEGGRFDLAIAVGILAASEVLPSAAFEGVELYGELSLGGDVHGTRGMLPSALQAGARRPRDDRACNECKLRRRSLAVRGCSRPRTCGTSVGTPRDNRRCRSRPARRGDDAAAGTHAGPRRRARAGGRATGTRDRRGGWTQRAVHRSARQRQEHARAAAVRPAAPARRRRGDRDCLDPFALLPRAAARPMAATPVPGATSHGVRDRDRRRRCQAATGRDLAGAQRRAVPRRTAGVPARRARSAA